MSGAKPSRLHKLALEAARREWGDAAWPKLTFEMRDAFLAQQVLLLLMAQCESSGKFEAAKQFVRLAMGWADEEVRP